MSQADDLLKNLASHSGFQLEIYIQQQRQREEEAKRELELKLALEEAERNKKRRGRPPKNSKLNEKRTCTEQQQKQQMDKVEPADTTNNTNNHEDEQLEEFLDDDEPFDYEKFAEKFPTICEADYQFSKGLELIRIEERDREVKGEVRRVSETATESEYEESDDTEGSDSEEFEDDYVRELTEESPEFLASLPKIAQMESLARRTGNTTENPNFLRNRWIHETFNRPLMQAVFEKSLRECGDSHIEGKLKYNRPMITLKTIEEFHDSIRLHLYRIILEVDALISQMDAIYSRARIQTPLPEISLDCRRFRVFKTENPGATLSDVLEAFYANQKKPRFVNRYQVQAEVVHEAARRIGADNYGASGEFAKLFDLITDAELEQLTVTSDLNCENDNKPAITSNTTTTAQTNNNLDFEKLQDAIKKALQSKLNKL